MELNFNKHLGSKLRMRRLALGLTQTKVAQAINVTFQQIQKYEKGTNGVSSIRQLQLSNYLKVPINYFFEDYSEYLINIEKSNQGYTNINYNFLVKLFSELNYEQKIKLSKNLQLVDSIREVKTGQFGSSGRTRTCDQLINSQLLYQLSYRGISKSELTFFQG